MKRKANTGGKVAASQSGGQLGKPLTLLLLALPLLAAVAYHFGLLQQLEFLNGPSSTPRLTYFAARGISEPIRLLLKDAGVNYIQNNFGMSVNGVQATDFKDMRASGVLDYGQVPYWEEDGLKLVQSYAIIRHLARKYGYNGNNEIEASKIDSIAEGCKDFVTAIRKSMNAAPDQKKDVWNTTVTVDIPKWLGFFEKLLQKSGTGYFVGNKISYADFFVVSVTEELSAHMGLEGFPLLAAHLKRVLERPNIAAYVAEPSRYPLNFARFIPK